MFFQGSTFLFFSTAEQCLSVASKSWQRCSEAFLSYSAAYRNNTSPMHFYTVPKRGLSKLFHRNANQCISFAMQSFSVPWPCSASQFPSVSMPCDSFALLCPAFPAQIVSSLLLSGTGLFHSVTVPLHNGAKPLRVFSVPFCYSAEHFIAFATTQPYFATAAPFCAVTRPPR